MRTTDVIRQILDLIDNIDNLPASAESAPAYEVPLDDNVARFRQIADLLGSDDDGEYANEPQERTAPLISVTTHAGGGVNGPKHPSDIRGAQSSMYPFTQYKGV